MAEWSFQRKLVTGVILVCLFAILTSVASLVASRVLISNMANVAATEDAALVAARELQLAALTHIADVRACLLTGGARYGEAARSGGEALGARAQALGLRAGDPGTQALIDSVGAAIRAHQRAFAHAGALSNRRADPVGSYSGAVFETGEHLEVTLAFLMARLQSTRSRDLKLSRAAVYRTESMLVVITTATILLLVCLCLMLVGALDESYRRQQDARRVAETGHDQARVTLSEVESASQLKDEFLATVSHELRNPLAPILTWTQLLRSGTLDAEKSKRALEVIERNVLSQAQLIDDLVDVSRVVSGKFRLDVRPIDLRPIIRTVAETQTPASDAKGVRLQLELDEQVGLISGDAERLQQVMWNLISNAIKFTPTGGSVQVALRRAGAQVEVAVTDSGSGIDPEFLPHVFEPFRQGTVGSMRRHGGLGLGLSIVRHIVELHGGEIQASSEGPGKGSRFLMRFPTLAAAKPEGEPPRRHPLARETPASGELARLDGIRVLLVEDEPTASEALLLLFESCGAQARGASCAAEAMTILDSWEPDVLVSDIAMPGEDGYALIRRIRLRPPEKSGRIPALALTAYAKIEDRVSILSSGFQMYLTKPADPNELLAVVHSLARQRGTFEQPGV